MHGVLLQRLSSRNAFWLTMFTAEVIAIVMLLLGPTQQNYWLSFFYLSIFLQWICLGSFSVFVLLSRLQIKWSTFSEFFAIIATMLAMTLIVSSLAILFFEQIFTNITWVGESRHLFVIKALIAASIFSLMLIRHLYVITQWQKQVVLEGEARATTLQTKMRPHFLFNVLNMIADLIHTEPGKAEEMIENVSELLRDNLKEGSNHNRIDDEILLCKKYIAIERCRLGERLEVDWHIDAALDQIKIPPFTLQPLIENAIYHGIQSLDEGGKVQIFIRMKGRFVNIEVINPIQSIQAANKKGQHMAIKNIKERLNIYYGKDASIEIDANERMYAVNVTMPRYRVQ